MDVVSKKVRRESETVVMAVKGHLMWAGVLCKLSTHCFPRSPYLVPYTV